MMRSESGEARLSAYLVLIEENRLYLIFIAVKSQNMSRYLTFKLKSMQAAFTIWYRAVNSRTLGSLISAWDAIILIQNLIKKSPKSNLGDFFLNILNQN